jgi:putative membrane protein
MRLLLNLLVNGLAVFITSQILPGVIIRDFFSAIMVSVVLGIANTIVKPVLILLTLPITVMTLGLFILLLNGLMVILASAVVPGFFVSNLGTAIIFSLVLSLVSWFLNSLKKEDK